MLNTLQWKLSPSGYSGVRCGQVSILSIHFCVMAYPTDEELEYIKQRIAEGKSITFRGDVHLKTLSKDRNGWTYENCGTGRGPCRYSVGSSKYLDDPLKKAINVMKRGNTLYRRD